MGKFIFLLVVILLIVGGLSMTRLSLGTQEVDTAEHTADLPGLPINANQSSSTTVPEVEPSPEEEVFTLRSQLGNEILVARPLSGQKITKSPLVTSGSAPSEWFKDGQFTVLLIDADGNILAEAPAYAQGDVAPNTLVRFKATVPYVRITDNPRATLILRADGKASLSNKTQVEILVNIL